MMISLESLKLPHFKIPTMELKKFNKELEIRQDPSLKIVSKLTNKLFHPRFETQEVAPADRLNIIPTIYHNHSRINPI